MDLKTWVEQNFNELNMRSPEPNSASFIRLLDDGNLDEFSKNFISTFAKDLDNFFNLDLKSKKAQIYSWNVSIRNRINSLGKIQFMYVMQILTLFVAL